MVVHIYTYISTCQYENVHAYVHTHIQFNYISAKTFVSDTEHNIILEGAWQEGETLIADPQSI